MGNVFKARVKWDRDSAVKVRVRLFSIYRERAGRAETELDLPAGSRVADVVRVLGERFPRLTRSGERESVLYSLNREYANLAEPLHDGDEVAVFPPVSGGAALPHGVLLLSGGFDSPVAAHQTLRGGRTLEALHFTMEPFTDDASLHKARRLAGILGLPRLTVIPLGDELAQLARTCEKRYYFVLMKRLMVRIAERLGRPRGASFLVTGENLGQVSSQTLASLAAIDAATTLPILRPLLGYDKQEIIRAAQAIGTFETSKGPEVCDVLGPKHPSTQARLDRVLAEEAKLDMESLVPRALAKALEVQPEAPPQPAPPASAAR